MTYLGGGWLDEFSPIEKAKFVQIEEITWDKPCRNALLSIAYWLGQ